MLHPRILLTASLAILLATPLSAEKARKPIPPLTAQEYPMHDEHELEHVAIAAEPGDTRETAPDTRLDYLANDMLPIRVIVTNDSEFDLTLDDARIHLISADNATIPAATDDELQRRMFTLKSANRKIPLPLPLPPITVHGNVDKKILADLEDFGFKTTTVKAHTTVAGYLFYDIQGLRQSNTDPPALDHATLELRKVRFAASNKALDSFEIPLHPTPLSSSKH
jgi:hypothetical protein